MKCLPFFVCVTVGNGLDRSAKKEKRIATPSSKARNDRPMSLLAKNPYFPKKVSRKAIGKHHSAASRSSHFGQRAFLKAGDNFRHKIIKFT